MICSTNETSLKNTKQIQNDSQEILFHLLQPIATNLMATLSSPLPVSYNACLKFHRALQLCLDPSPHPPIDLHHDMSLVGPKFLNTWHSLIQSSTFYVSSKKKKSSYSFLPLQRNVAHYLLLPCFQMLDQLFKPSSFSSSESFIILILNCMTLIWKNGNPYHLNSLQSILVSDSEYYWYIASYAQSLSCILNLLSNTSSSTVPGPNSSSSKSHSFTSSFSEEIQLRALYLLRLLFFSSPSVSFSSSSSFNLMDYATLFSTSPATHSTPIYFSIASKDTSHNVSSSATKSPMDLYSFLSSPSGMSLVGPLVTCLIHIFSCTSYPLELRLHALSLLRCILLDRSGHSSDSIVIIAYPLLLSRLTFLYDTSTTHTFLLLESLPLLVGMIGRVLSSTPLDSLETQLSQDEAYMLEKMNFIKKKLGSPTCSKPRSHLPSKSPSLKSPSYKIERTKEWWNETQSKTHIVLQKIIQSLSTRAETGSSVLLVHAVHAFSSLLNCCSTTLLISSRSLLYRFCTSLAFSTFPDVVQATDTAISTLSTSSKEYKDEALKEVIQMCQGITSELDDKKITLLNQLAGVLKYYSFSFCSFYTRIYHALSKLLYIDKNEPFVLNAELQSTCPLACWNYTMFHSSSVYPALNRCFKYLATAIRVSKETSSFIEQITIDPSILNEGQKEDQNAPLSIQFKLSKPLLLPKPLITSNSSLHSSLAPFPRESRLQQLPQQQRYSHWLFLNHFLKEMYIESIISQYCLLLRTSEDLIEQTLFLQGFSLTELPHLSSFLVTFLPLSLTLSHSSFRPLQLAANTCLQSFVLKLSLNTVSDLILRYSDTLLHTIHSQLKHLFLYPDTPQLMVAVMSATSSSPTLVGSLFQKEIWALLVQGLSLNRNEWTLWKDGLKVIKLFIEVISSVSLSTCTSRTSLGSVSKIESKELASVSPWLLKFFSSHPPPVSKDKEMDSYMNSSSASNFMHHENETLVKEEQEMEVEKDLKDTPVLPPLEATLFYLLQQLRYLLSASPTKARVLILQCCSLLFQRLSLYPQLLQPFVYKFCSQIYLKQKSHFSLYKLELEHTLTFFLRMVEAVPNYGPHVLCERYLEDLFHVLQWEPPLPIACNFVLLKLFTKLVQPKWTSTQINGVFQFCFDLLSLSENDDSKDYLTQWEMSFSDLVHNLLHHCGDPAWFLAYVVYLATCDSLLTSSGFLSKFSIPLFVLQPWKLYLKTKNVENIRRMNCLLHSLLDLPHDTEKD